MTTTRLLISAASLVGLLILSAGDARADQLKCQVAKANITAKYCACLVKAWGKFIQSDFSSEANDRYTSATGKCDLKLTNKFTALDAKAFAGGFTCYGDVVDSLAIGASCGGNIVSEMGLGV